MLTLLETVKGLAESNIEGFMDRKKPCGLTPDVTCLIAPSFPAASMA
jgi:hypothetical protein